MNKSAERTINIFLGLALLLFAYVTPAVGAVPQLLNYQGYLTNAASQPVNATVTMTFRLYNAPGPVAELYSETQSVTVINGVYDVIIGSVTPLTLPFDVPYYVGVTVGGDAEMTPRQTVTATPYALQAANAFALGGLAASRYVATDANGNVGIGTGTPLARLALSGGPNWTASGWTGSLALPNASAIGWDANASGQRFGIGQSSTGLFFFRTASSLATTTNPADYKMVIADSGNVGIGTTSPSNTLDVNGSIRAFNGAGGDVITETSGGTNSWAKFWVRTPVQQWSIGSSNNFNGNQLYFVNESLGQIRMAIMPNGNVGIGTANPTRGKLEVLGASYPGNIGSCGFLNAAGAGSAPTCYPAASVYADWDMVAQQFWAFSDKRMKRIAGRSNAARDLAILTGIEVTDYTYVDTIAHGSGRQKKVIGQQVERVFPQAVSRSTDVVPDIYRKAEVRDGWISLATNLKRGERVRLIGMKKDSIHEVLEVAPGRFRTDFAPDGDQVFVYGREVKDFRKVDYEAIAMLNVSSTQELNRRLEKQANDLAAQAAEIAALKRQLTRMAQLAEKQASLLAQAMGLADARGDILGGQADALAHGPTSAPPDHPSYP